MLPGLICLQIVGSSGSMGKSVKPSGEPSVVQIQQRNHGETAESADGREPTNEGTDRHGEIAHERILSGQIERVLGLVMANCLLRFG